MPVISKITGAPFRFWCQKILPAVYDDSLSYYELLCKVVDYLNKVMEDDLTVINYVNELEEYMNNYFNNLDVQEEINNKLDSMAEDGTLYEIIERYTQPIIDSMNADIAEYKADTDSQIETYKSETETTITEFQTETNSSIDIQDNKIAVLEGRMDTFSALPDGSLSTAADAELVDIRTAGNGKTYANAGDAVRAQFGQNQNAVKTFDNYIPLTWETGAINRDTGEITVSDDRIYSSLFTANSQYLDVYTEKTGNLIIEIYRYNTDDTYADYQYLVVRNNSIIGYVFDTTHKYRIVSREISYPITICGNTDYKLTAGSINTSGVFNPYATNTVAYKPIEVTANSVLEFVQPGCNTDLFVYDTAGNYLKSLSYIDTSNHLGYFPLIPGFKYRVYFSTENQGSCSVTVKHDTEYSLFTGGVYNGTAIVSTGNNRTNLINVTDYKYLYVTATVTSVVHKFKNNEYIGQSTAYCAVFSPAVVNVEDADYVFIASSGLSNITFTMNNNNALIGKKWCSYGDSITEQQRWQNYLVAKYGLVLSNKGLGGSCVTGNTASSVTPMTDSGRINTIDTDTNIITVMGGTNDFDYCTSIGSIEALQTSYDESTFIGSVASIVKKLQTRCPNATIILMSNPNTRGTTGQTSDTQPVSAYGYTPYDFAKAMKDAAEWLSVPFIDVWSCGINQLNRTAYVDDTVHPNTAGGKKIADKVMEYFNNKQ